MDALATRAVIRADERRRCGRKIVWSWPPDAEAKRASERGSRAMGARKPGSQGERDISVKTVAQGMPDVSAGPVVPSPCLFIARGPWVAASTRHSLRPLSIQRATRDASLGHFVPRECEPLSFSSLTGGIWMRGGTSLSAVVPDKLAGRASARAASADPRPITTGGCWREERRDGHLDQRLEPVVMGPPVRGGDRLLLGRRRAHHRHNVAHLANPAAPHPHP